MINRGEILQTIEMIDQQHLDVRTVTMGISLLDCCDADPKAACRKIYDKITRSAKDLVKTGEDIEAEFGIPIVNKRISVTPISLVAGGVGDGGLRAVRAGAGRGAGGDGRELRRRLFGAGAEGHDARGPAAHPGHTRRPWRRRSSSAPR